MPSVRLDPDICSSTNIPLTRGEISDSINLYASWPPRVYALHVVNNQRHFRIVLNVLVLQSFWEIYSSNVKVPTVEIKAHWSDIRLQPFRGSGYPEILASMQSGALDGGIISPPMNLRAQDLGFRELIDAGSIGFEYASTCYGTTRPFIRDRRETVAQFTRSLTEAIHRFKTGKAGSLKIIQQYTKTRDGAVLEETYRVYAQKFLPRAPYPTINGVKAILDSLGETIPAAKTASPETFVDLSFVQELEKSGAIARLYQ